MNKQFYVYILANVNHSVFYVGVTNHLARRISEHKDKRIDGFTKKYNITQLLYYEIFEDPVNAITREKQIKGYRREKKVNLIETFNPKWEDLYDKIL